MGGHTGATAGPLPRVEEQHPCNLPAPVAAGHPKHPFGREQRGQRGASPGAGPGEGRPFPSVTYPRPSSSSFFFFLVTSFRRSGEHRRDFGSLGQAGSHPRCRHETRPHDPPVPSRAHGRCQYHPPASSN